MISVSTFPTPTPSTPTSTAHPWLSAWVEANAQELRACDIYTDGSCTPNTSLTSHILRESSTASSGSVVLIERGCSNNYGFMLHITEGAEAGITSAAAMELLSATTACTIRDILYKTIPREDMIHIFSDSRSTVHRLQDCDATSLRKLAHKRYGPLYYSLFRKARRNTATVHHVYGHPEKHKPRDSYSPVELGNAFAHDAASPKAASKEFPGFVRFFISAKELLQDLLCLGQWYIGDENGVPLMRTTTELSELRTTRDYLLQRDEARQAASPPRPNFWSSTSLRMAAHQFDSNSRKRTFAQQTRVTKVIFDKYFHGENRVKGCKDPALKDELQACLLCGDYDSEEHGYCHCQGPRHDNLLQPIRSALFGDITTKINALPFGPAHALLMLYREFASEASHPHRVWKGCLTTSQLAQITALTDIPMSWKERTVLISALRQVQYLFANAVLRIRTQLTSYALPHMRGAPPPPTPHQIVEMSTLRNQPRITDALWGPGAGLTQGAIASRNSLRRRKAMTTPSTKVQRILCFHPRDTAAITLQAPTSPSISLASEALLQTTPTDSRHEASTARSSPCKSQALASSSSHALLTPSSSPPVRSSRRRRARRISISPSWSPSIQTERTPKVSQHNHLPITQATGQVHSPTVRSSSIISRSHSSSDTGHSGNRRSSGNSSRSCSSSSSSSSNSSNGCSSSSSSSSSSSGCSSGSTSRLPHALIDCHYQDIKVRLPSLRAGTSPSPHAPTFGATSSSVLLGMPPRSARHSPDTALSRTAASGSEIHTPRADPLGLGLEPHNLSEYLPKEPP